MLGFLTAGIAHRETYYYRRVYVDALRMLEVAGPIHSWTRTG